jgi:hypothetical protein
MDAVDTPRLVRPAALAGLAVAAALLAGCGDGGSTTAAPPPAGPTAAVPTTVAPTRTAGVPGGAITSPPAAGAGEAGLLPAGFPIPPGTKVGPVSLAGGSTTATLTVGEGKAGYDYWRQQLPAAGYAIAKAEMVGGIGEITFSGNGCASGSQLGISDQNVTLECRR